VGSQIDVVWCRGGNTARGLCSCPSGGGGEEGQAGTSGYKYVCLNVQRSSDW